MAATDEPTRPAEPGKPGGVLVSIVGPARNEADALADFVAAVLGATADVDARVEIVLVDDGSTDGTWPLIEQLSEADARVRGVRLSRHFGKDAAILAGLEQARGEAVVVMDTDLQHPPALLPELIDRYRHGARVVEAVKRDRSDQTLSARAGGALFNRVFTRLTGVDLTGATDYRLMARPVVDTLLAMPERAIFFRATSTWVGFERDRVPFDVDARASGRSRFTLRALTRSAISGLTTFTSAPLHLVTIVGVLFAAFATVLGIHTVVRWLSGDAVEGFTTVILLLLIQGSVVMLALGVIGEYLARIHDEVKHRPRFVVAARTSDRDPRP